MIGFNSNTFNVRFQKTVGTMAVNGEEVYLVETEWSTSTASLQTYSRRIVASESQIHEIMDIAQQGCVDPEEFRPFWHGEAFELRADPVVIYEITTRGDEGMVFERATARRIA